MKIWAFTCDRYERRVFCQSREINNLICDTYPFSLEVNITSDDSIFPANAGSDKTVSSKAFRLPYQSPPSFFSCELADFLWVRVTALLARRRGIYCLKWTPPLPPVNANWRRPNWIIGGNAAIPPVMWTYRWHVLIFILISLLLSSSFRLPLISQYIFHRIFYWNIIR